MSIVIISLVCNIMLSKYGAIVINIVVGIIIGAQPILGYNYGARNYDRVRKTFKTVLLLTILVGIIFSSILVVVFFRGIRKAKIENNIPNAVLKKSAPGVIITIARQHGSQGKYIGKLVAEKLNIPYYYKEMTALAAQDRVIKEIAENGSCVIVGRAADYVLRDNLEWGKLENYDLCINSSIGKEETANIICEFVKAKKS